MAITNLQVSKDTHIRCEDEVDGDACLTLVHLNAQNQFEFETIMLIPKLQRENLANFLLSFPCPKPNSLTSTP